MYEGDESKQWPLFPNLSGLGVRRFATISGGSPARTRSAIAGWPGLTPVQTGTVNGIWQGGLP